MNYPGRMRSRGAVGAHGLNANTASNCHLDLNGYNVKVKPPPPKPLIWMGSSKKDLRALPADVVDVFGYALYVAQTGKRYDHTKVLKGF